jgi:hypothetical protein
MADTLPPPLVPAGVRVLRASPRLVLTRAYLFGDAGAAPPPPEDIVARLRLAMAGHDAEPPASLPNDDRELARLSGAGSRWSRLKLSAMDGWVLCSDNRWYHPAVAAWVVDEWRLSQAQSSRAAKRWAKVRADAGAPPNDAAPVPRHTDSHTRAMPTSGSDAIPATSTSKKESNHLPRVRARDSRSGTIQQVGMLLPIRGGGSGHSGRWADQNARDAYAVQACIAYLPGRDEGERWAIALAAEDTDNPNHERAVGLMLKASREAGVGWVSPSRRGERQKMEGGQG